MKKQNNFVCYCCDKPFTNTAMPFACVEGNHICSDCAQECNGMLIEISCDPNELIKPYEGLLPEAGTVIN